MKSLIFSSAILLGLALATTPLFAKADFASVKAQVEQVAKSAGADTSTLEKASPVRSTQRSQAGMTAVNRVDNVLLLSAETAALVASKAGVYCTLEKCPHAGTLADAKLALKELDAELSDGELNKLTLAAKLHHAAASILKATRTQVISDPSRKVNRTQVVKTNDESKLELASQLADVTSKLLEVK